MMNTNGLSFEKEYVLVTGCAGFIGGSLVKRLVENTDANILGIDNLNDYYDVNLKEYRLNQIAQNDDNKKFRFVRGDISDKQFLMSIFSKYKPTIVIHFAAQAGVRYSIDNPDAYMKSNVVGFYNMLEVCRNYCMNSIANGGIKHLIYASSSSVYGNNIKIPYSVQDRTDTPVSFYAATKKMDEIMAYSYAKLYGIPMTGLRFFTVYGPAGRPDMAYFKFTQKLLRGEKIRLYNYGKNQRDFTYITDVLDAIIAIMKSIPKEDENGVRHRIYNIGNNCPVSVRMFVEILEKSLKNVGLLPCSFDFKKIIELTEPQPGDVTITCADVEKLKGDFSVLPHVKVDEGLKWFAEWYKKYYGEKA